MAQLAAIPQTGGLGSIAQLIQQLAPIFLGSGAQNQSGSSSGSSNQTTTQGTATNPDILAQIQQLLGQVQGQGAGFTKDQAIADSDGAINTQILDAIRANMPSVLGGQKAAGLYNDSTTGLLTNDLMARIAGEAAKARTNTITQYGQLANQSQNTAANLLNALAQSNRTQVSNQAGTENKTQAQTTQTQPIVSPKASLGGLGAMGLLSAFKQGKDLFSGGKDLVNSLFPSEGVNPAGTFAGFNPATDFVGGGFNDAMDSDVLAGLGGSVGDAFAGFGGFDPLGQNFGDFSSLFSSSGDAASQIGSFAGVGNDLSGVFTGASDTLGGLDSGIDLGSSAASDLGGSGDFFAGLGDLGKKFTDTLGDGFGSIGDFFGGFFADGGLVGKDPRASLISNFEVNKLPPDARLLQVARKYADGGIVEDAPKNVVRGRAGGKAYTADASTAKAAGGFGNLQRIRALWEQVAGNGAAPTFTAPSVVAGNEDALSGASRGSTALLPELSQLQDLANTREARRSSAMDEQIQNAISRVEDAVRAQQEVAPSTGATDALRTASQLRSAYSSGSKIAAGAAPVAATAGDIAVASGIGGAGAALGGSALAGGTLGTVDVLGSLAGSGAFLPGYASAAGAAGTGASSALFGGAGGAAGGASQGLGATATGVGAVIGIPLLASSVMSALVPDETPLEAWQRVAADPFRAFSSPDAAIGNSQGLVQFFDPTNPANKGLSREQMFQNAVRSIQDPGFWDSEANRAAAAAGYGGGASAGENSMLGAIVPYATQVAKYLRDTDQLNDQYYRSAYKTQKFQEAKVAPNYTDSIFGSGENDRKKKQIEDDVAGMSLEDIYASLSGAQNILSPGQYSSSSSQNLTTAQQMQLQGIPERTLGFGGSGGAAFDPATGLQFADGGMIGTPAADPKGNKDNVPILASEGEYVIPKPVVDMLGQQFFDGLLQAFNVPSVQR